MAKPSWRMFYCNNDVVMLGSAERGEREYLADMASKTKDFRRRCPHANLADREVERIFSEGFYIRFEPLHSSVDAKRDFFDYWSYFEHPSFLSTDVFFSDVNVYDTNISNFMFDSLNIFFALASEMKKIEAIVNKSIEGMFGSFVPLWSCTRSSLLEHLFTMPANFSQDSSIYSSSNIESPQRSSYESGTYKYDDFFTGIPSQSRYAEDVSSKSKSSTTRKPMEEEVVTGIEAFKRLFPKDIPKMNDNKELILDKAINFDNPEDVEKFVFTLLCNSTVEKIVFPNGKTYTFKEALSLFKNTDILDGLSSKLQDGFRKLDKQQQYPSILLEEVPLLRYFSEKSSRRRMQLAVHPDKVMTEDNNVRGVAESIFKIAESIITMLKEYE